MTRGEMTDERGRTYYFHTGRYRVTLDLAGGGARVEGRTTSTKGRSYWRGLPDGKLKSGLIRWAEEARDKGELWRQRIAAQG